VAASFGILNCPFDVQWVEDFQGPVEESLEKGFSEDFSK
jgi:hypothetical protein